VSVDALAAGAVINARVGDAFGDASGDAQFSGGATFAGAIDLSTFGSCR
tara:strand:- start:423 stop:569 length:147 start_codon:yes stop_codon:yes gene_type:complete